MVVEPTTAAKEPEEEAVVDSSITSFDDVLHVIGANGRFQKQILFVMMLVAISVGSQNMSPVFTLNIPDHRCALPDIPNDTYSAGIPVVLVTENTTISRISDEGTDQCNVWYEEFLELGDGQNSSTDHTLSVDKRPCSKWVYDKSVFERTLTEELDLVCERKLMRSHSNMLIFLGKFFGSFLQGVLSDRFGRRKVAIVTVLSLLGATVGNAFVSSPVTLFVLRFFTGLTTTAAFLSVYVLAVEFTGPSNRTTAASVLKMSSATGQLLLDIAAFFTRDWKLTQLCLVSPAALASLCLWMTPESPRWLLAKGDMKAVEKVIKRAAKVNKAELPDNALKNLKANEHETSAPAHQLFTSSTLVVRWIIVYVNWIVIGMVYYGLTLNISNLSGNIFINFLISVSTELVGVSVATRIVGHVSRKYFIAATLMFCGVACSATFVPILLDANRWVVVSLSMGGKLGIACAYYLIYAYTAEVFPTTHRGFGMGSSSMIARTGGMASPYVADLNTIVQGGFGQVLPQLVFGGAGILASLLTLIFLPDTRNRTLPETIEDAKNFTKSKSKGMAKGKDSRSEDNGAKEKSSPV